MLTEYAWNATWYERPPVIQLVPDPFYCLYSANNGVLFATKDTWLERREHLTPVLEVRPTSCLAFVATHRHVIHTAV